MNSRSMKAQPVRRPFLVNSSLIRLPVQGLLTVLQELRDRGNAISLKKSEAYSNSRGQGGMFTAVAMRFSI